MNSYFMGIEETPGLAFPLHYLCRYDYRHKPEGSVPTIIYLHGFTGGKESHLDVRMDLADIGYLVVSFDAHSHGARGPLAELWNSCRTDFPETFFTVLEETAQDTEEVLAVLSRDPHVNRSRMGLIGGSMGAMVCLMAIPRLDGLKAAVSLAGTADLPRWYEETAGHDVYRFEKKPLPPGLRARLRRRDPIHQAESYPPVALLMVHGAEDPVVPPRGQRELYEKLKPLYEKQGAALAFRLYPELGHETSAQLLADVHEWLKVHL